MKATSLALVAACVALVLPGLSRADEPPSPAVAACKAEYVQLGAAGFIAKYSAGETLGACLAAHGGSTTATPTAPPPTGPEAACKAEYLQLGAAAFLAKYGMSETFGACLRAHDATAEPSGDVAPTSGKTPEKPKFKPHADGSTSVAAALCVAEGKALGKDAFQAKYGGKGRGVAACVKASLPKASSIVAACKASSSATKDAFRQCVAAALKNAAG